MDCQSFDKDVRCTAPATEEVFWPGKTTVACDEHAKRLRFVASAMGFTLDSRPITGGEKAAPQG